MPASLPPIQDYYKLTFQCSDPGGSTFPLSFAFARMDVYNGDGTELGDQTANGKRQLRRIVDKLADGLARNGWGPATITEVKANTSTTLAITLPTPD